MNDNYPNEISINVLDLNEDCRNIYEAISEYVNDLYDYCLIDFDFLIEEEGVIKLFNLVWDK